MIVHLVTDRRRLAGPVPLAIALNCLLTQVGHAVAAGVDCIQIRERDLEARELVALSLAVVAMTRGTRTRVVVNDRIDAALASGADGVHLRADSVTTEEARRIAPQGFLIGRSVHRLADLADAAGSDYLIAGTVWATESKTPGHTLIGPDGLHTIADAAMVPVLAIGGVGVERVGEIARAGGAGIAAIGLFLDGTQDAGCRACPLVERVAVMRRRFDTSGSPS